MANLLDRAALHGGARFGNDLILYRKTLLTLEGLVDDLDPAHPMDAALFAEASRRLFQEWPARLAQAPMSRAFSTHLSNFDLARLFWSGPAAMLRYWTGAVG